LRLGRLILAVCGTAALAAASGVFVVALSLALYAALEPTLGAAGAAASVAVACLLILAAAGLALLLIATRRPRPAAASEGGDFGADLLELARRRPFLALFGAAAATAIGLSALRNPRAAPAALTCSLRWRPLGQGVPGSGEGWAIPAPAGPLQAGRAARKSIADPVESARTVPPASVTNR
jgi:hypothetical protein